jgi:predicted oxidoreductase
MHTDDAAAVRVQAVMTAIAPRYHDATFDQLAYAWIMAHPSRPVPIVGSNKIERVAAAVRAAQIELTREDWYALWTAAQGRNIP